MREVLFTLERAGMRQWTDFTRERVIGQEYSALWFRKYSTKDWNESKFLVLCSRSGSEIYNCPDGRVRYAASKTSPKADFVGDRAGQGHWIIVPDRVKNELERAGLLGLRFDEAIPFKKDWTANGAVVLLKEPPPRLGWWWRLSSNVTMPPMSPTCDVRVSEWPQVGRDGRPLPFALKPGEPPFMSLNEGLFVYPEPHYRAADVEAMAPFDAALTREKFGGTITGPSYDLIVSNRFYKVCRALEYRISWIPVRLD